MADAYSENESQDEGDYGGISANTLRFIGVNPQDHASTSAGSANPTRIDEVIKMLMATQANNSAANSASVVPSAADLNDSPTKGRRRGAKSKLPRELQGLMGEANMKFARGEYEEVMMMCQEIIKSAPTAPEPYQTLSMLHEEMGDSDNAYQFGLVAAHLDPRNSQEWLRLAEMSMEAGNLRECAKCYWQVAKYDRENTSAMLESAQLELQLGEYKKAAEVLDWILDSKNANSDSTLYMSVTKELAKLQHSRGKRDTAIQVLEKAIDVHPEFITSEEVNLLAEFYVGENNYQSVISVLTNHCGVICSLESDVVSIPRELPLDLRSKLVISLCFSGAKEKTIKETLREFEDEDIADVGDLLIDMSESLQDNGYHTIALPLLQKLVHTEKYSQAAVWLKYSECLSALGRIREASDAYGIVVEMAPNHVSARVQLSLLQQQLGLDKEALNTLAEGGVSASSVRNDWSGLEGKEPRLLLHTCLVLLSQDKLEDFFRYVQYLLFGQLPPHIVIEHEPALMTLRALKSRMAYLRKLLPDFDKNYAIPPAKTGDSENALKDPECWDLFIQACDVASKHRRYDTLFVLCKSAFCSQMFFSKKNWCEEVDFKVVCSHVLLHHGGSSFDLFREHVMKMVQSPDATENQIMNLFSMITSICPHDVRFCRFSMRLLKRFPTCIGMNFAHGHASIIFSSYRAAINQYITAYKLIGEDNPSPILCLLIGVCFLNIVCMKFTTQRATLAVQGVCFLDRYMKVRGHCQEVYYNLGRAMQQISINSAAVYYYKKCIDTPPSVEGDNFDLTCEAAFNLSLIYKASGSHELAEHVLQTHCVV